MRYTQRMDVHWRHSGDGGSGCPHSGTVDLTSDDGQYWYYQCPDPPSASGDTICSAEVFNNDEPATYVEIVILLPGTRTRTSTFPTAFIRRIEPALTLPTTTQLMELDTGSPDNAGQFCLV